MVGTKIGPLSSDKKTKGYVGTKLLGKKAISGVEIIFLHLKIALIKILKQRNFPFFI